MPLIIEIGKLDNILIADKYKSYESEIKIGSISAQRRLKCTHLFVK